MIRGMVFCVLSACCYGFLPILGKMALAHGMGVFEMLSYRFGLGAIILCACLAVFRPSALRIPLPILGKAAVLGMILYPVQSSCFMKALEYIPASTTTLILYIYPVTVTLLTAVVYKESIRRQTVVSLVLVMAGCAAVFWDAFLQSASLTGVGYALGAMAAFTLYITASQALLRGQKPLTVALYVIASAGVMFTILAGPPDLARFTPARAGIALGLAVVPTVLAVSLLYLGIEAVGSAWASIFSTLEPVTTLLAAWALLDERLAAWQLLGAALIVAGIVLPNAGLLRKKRLVQPPVH